jgi:hypothetical protein
MMPEAKIATLTTTTTTTTPKGKHNPQHQLWQLRR